MASKANETHPNYLDYGTNTELASGDYQEIKTAYDNDGYNTYPVAVTNELGHTVFTEYGYALGLPWSITDASGIQTQAIYDNFGRLHKVIKPGDSDAFPTVLIAYQDGYPARDPFVPFMVDLHQRVESGEGDTYSIRKFYNGLGQLIQTQSPRATLEAPEGDCTGTVCDIIVDYDYDSNGRLIQQTLPYASYQWTSGGEPPTPWRDPDLSQPSTHSTYDGFGR